MMIKLLVRYYWLRNQIRLAGCDYKKAVQRLSLSEEYVNI